MRYGNRLAMLSAIVGLAQVVAPRACQAGPIIDWLFGHHTPYYAQPIYAPPTYAQPAATIAPAPSYAPSTGYTGSCLSCNSCWRAASCQPDPYYRTTWAQMPVTNYRPVVTVNPASGYPVTTYLPCQTSVWQARRLPSYGVYRPFYAGNAPAAVPSGCATCGIAAPAASPYYAPATPTSTFGPATISPSRAAPGAILAPSRGAADPADTQPSLSPGGLSPSSPPTIRNFTPLDSVTPPLDPPGGLQLNSPAAMQKQSAPTDRLRLVPDPDAPAGRDEPNRAPPLLRPREKTAAAPRIIQPASAEMAIPAAPAQNVKWDDTGWRSLRP